MEEGKKLRSSRARGAGARHVWALLAGEKKSEARGAKPLRGFIAAMTALLSELFLRELRALSRDVRVGPVVNYRSGPW